MMKVLLPALLLLPACVAPASTGPADRLNVLFITVDDMNWDSVGAFGCTVPDVTPHIDRLASEGMKFRHGHVTIAICQPTRAVWMTGRYPHRSGALGFDPIDKGVPTLVEALKEHGYFTGIMAKTGHVVPTRRHAFDVSIPASDLAVGRDPELYRAKAKAFFAAAKAAGKPFFLMANMQDPHRPFAGSAHEQGRKTGKKRKPSKFPGVRRTYRPDEITVPKFLPDIPDVRKELAEYFTSVHRADEVAGAVLEALDAAGHRESTLVMFVSDHGMPLPFAKTNCWYQSTRTPWIVRWPGVVKPGSEDTRHFVSGIDTAPTMLDALGLPPLEGMDGRSFVEVLKGGTQEGRERVFTHINRTAGKNAFPMRSVQDAEYGYIWNGWADGTTRFKNESQSGLTMKAMIKAAENDAAIAARVNHFLYRTPEELYHYASDPAALKNLAADPAHRDRLAAYRAALLKHMEETGDPQREAFRAHLSR